MDDSAGRVSAPIDITGEMEAYFGLVEIGREFAIQSTTCSGRW